jgi:hypothetical protein
MTDSFFKKGAIFGGMTCGAPQVIPPKIAPSSARHSCHSLAFAKETVFLK